MARNDAQPDRRKAHGSKAVSWSFEHGISSSPDDRSRADAVRRTLANLIARQIAAELQAREQSPAAQPQVGNAGAEAGEDRKAAARAAAARKPDAAPGSTTCSGPTESRHTSAMPQGHGGARV